MVFSQMVCVLVRTVRPWLADSPPMYKVVSDLAFHIDRSRTIRPRHTDHLGFNFSDITGRFTNGLYSRYWYGRLSGHGAWTVRVCAELVLVAQNG
jgi:hypothetical protein